MTRERRAPPPLAAFVLHSWNWSESSLIVDLFTREVGRLVVVAKGAKRPYSQLRPVLLPFQRLAVGLGRAGDEAEVLPLRSAEWAGGVPPLAAGQLLHGFYLNELLLRLLARQDPHAALFDAYADTLTALGGADERAAQAALRAFELMLLRETGVLPDLGVVTPTQLPVQPGVPYALRPQAGLVGAAAGEPALDGGVLVALQAALPAPGSVSALQALRAVCADHLAALRTPLRQLLHYHLGSAPLHTREVMRDLQRLAADRCR